MERCDDKSNIVKYVCERNTNGEHERSKEGAIRIFNFTHPQYKTSPHMFIRRHRVQKLCANKEDFR
jgi:hypothetical protein